MVDRDDGRPERDVDAARRHEQRAVAERAADPREVAALPADLVVARPQPEKTTSSYPVPWIARATPFRSSALNGSMSATSTPITFVRRLRRLWATRLDVVAELLDHRPHPRRGLLGDAVAAVDHLRHGRDRDAGLGGDVADRQPPLGHGAILTHLETVIDNG